MLLKFNELIEMNLNMNEIIVKKIEKEDIMPLFLPMDNKSHKGNFGQLVIIGGSKNYVGAPLLANMGACAMRVGAGTNVLAVPKFLASDIRKRVLTSSIFEMKDDGERILCDELQLAQIFAKATAFSIGMGFGNGESGKICKAILKLTDCNFVLDADGLKTAMKKIDAFQSRAVLTPHVGEFCAITGLPKEYVLANRIDCAVKLARYRASVVVLKSDKTIVTDGKEVWLNETGNAKLATGGSGDVLSGIIGGLLARGVSPLNSAKAGCWILGRCAEISEINEYSHLASDTANLIPKVLDELQGKI